MERKITLGVFGGGRGAAVALCARSAGFEIVAVCDAFEPLLRHAEASINDESVVYYTDFDRFLEHDGMEAVLIANYATQHVWAAVKALNAGKHVMSECMAMFTMAEAVELVEAVEASGRVYMFAENYPFTAERLEMKRLYDSGEMGEFRYGEAEYIHPVTPRVKASLTSGPDHWRCWLPVNFYYSTHSMGPVMHITGTRPTTVNGLAIPYDFNDPVLTGQPRKSDLASLLICRMDNGALAKIMPCAFLRDHGERYRFCCSRGTMEMNQGNPELRVHHELFDFDPPKPVNLFYKPNFPEEFRLLAEKCGHNGGDFFTSYFFAKAIRDGSRPMIDVYQAIDMTSIGILGYRSALQGGIPIEIPDFRDRTVREQYRHDDWNPDPARRREGMPYSSVLGDIELPAKTLEDFYRYRREYREKL